MPKEYEGCRDAMVKRGVPMKEAKARCAAKYYKRHGVTVREAHKRGAAVADLDEEEAGMTESILILGQTFEPPPSGGDLPKEGKRILSEVYTKCRRAWVQDHPDDKENPENKERCAKIAWTAVKQAGFKTGGAEGSESVGQASDEIAAKAAMGKTPTINREDTAVLVSDICPLEGANPFLEDGLLTIVATRVGASAFVHTNEGAVRVRWTKDALAAAAKSWVGARVSANHEPIDEGQIATSRMDGDLLVQTVTVSDELRAAIEKVWPDIGVSTEARVRTAGEAIIEAAGTGVTFVFWPKRPACTREDGCRVLGFNLEEVANMAENKEHDCDCDKIKADAEKAKEAIATAEAARADFETKLKAAEAELTDLRAFRDKELADRRKNLIETAVKLGAKADNPIFATLPVSILEAVVEAMELVAKAAEGAIGSGAQPTAPPKVPDTSGKISDEDYLSTLKAEAALLGKDADEYVKQYAKVK